MSRLVLVHWHEGECAERALRLERLGHEVVQHWSKEEGSKGPALRSLTEDPPDAIVLDLARLPSHAAAIAEWVRQRKATRGLPLVFVRGDAHKTAAMRARYPDAVFTTWGRIGPAVANAIAAPPAAPIVPAHRDYSGTPLPKKLGIKEDSRVAFVRAPRDFAATLGHLPRGVAQKARLAGELDVVVLFCRALAELRADFGKARDLLAEHGGLWVAWPKKSSGVLTDLDDNVVRAYGLDQGLVDNKVCAIDATWSGARFARRRQVRS